MHRNPVRRGLTARPEDWPWSSFRHYLTGEIARSRSNPIGRRGDGTTQRDICDTHPSQNRRRVGHPSIRSKGLSRHKFPVRCVSAAMFAREVEDQSSGLNHAASAKRWGLIASPTIDTALSYRP
jgi:hypothetical protein